MPFYTDRVLNGSAVAKVIRSEVADGVKELAKKHRAPRLVVLLVGEDPASKIYVGNKTKACAEVGIDGETVELPASTPQEELLERIESLNEDDSVDGILVQLPLPEGHDVAQLQWTVSPDKDVDGLHPINAGKLWQDQDCFVPCTPAGIIEMLERREFEMAGRHAVVVGRSAIVGKPMAALLLRQNCTVTVCHSRTKSLEETCREADILVAAVGQVGLIGPNHVQAGAVVIDVGMNRLTERRQIDHYYPGDEKRRRAFEKKGSVLIGDVDFTRVLPKASAITPVPGGVGPLTIAMLMVNTLESAKRRLQRTKGD